eukprot:785284_1
MTIITSSISQISSKLRLRRNLKRFKKGGIKLDEILTNKRALSTFFQFLTGEFSGECLIAYISFTRYQRYLLKEIGNINDIILNDNDLSTIQPLTNFKSSPTTKLVSMIINGGFYQRTRFSFDENENNKESENCNDKLLKHAKIEAHKLYHYFIAIESKYQINISG